MGFNNLTYCLNMLHVLHVTKKVRIVIFQYMYHDLKTASPYEIVTYGTSVTYGTIWSCD